MMDLDDPLDRFLLESVMWEMGILPLDFKEQDVGRRLAQLPPEEAQRLKRRFRKAWRALKRKKMSTLLHKRGADPGRKAKKIRKSLVLYECMRAARRKKETLS